jgi:hypothetical protein
VQLLAATSLAAKRELVAWNEAAYTSATLGASPPELWTIAIPAGEGCGDAAEGGGTAGGIAA